MNVPNIEQSGGATAPLRDAANPAGVTTRGSVSGDARPSEDISLRRLAWFDVNGDGHIDPRAASAGGDATLLVPAHSVDLPTYSRTVSHAFPTRSQMLKQESERDAHADARPDRSLTPAQARQAVDAYQRYGQTAGSPAPPAPAAPILVPVAAPAVERDAAPAANDGAKPATVASGAGSERAA